MWLRIDPAIPIALLLLVASTVSSAQGSGAAAGADDEMTAWLERHGVPHLLALHLEERMESAPPQERQAFAIRLAAIYAELLERTDDLSTRVDLESRSRSLISMVPEREADELRLALLRGAYTSVERIAENHRLRLASAEDIERARQTLRDLLPQFATLRATFEDRLESIERQRRRANPEQSMAMIEQATRRRDLLNRCTFLNAWALYYDAFLLDRRESARNAEELFAHILDPDARTFRIDHISKDLLSTEPYARTLLGYALSIGMTAPTEQSMRVFDVLEGSEVFAAVSQQVPAWRLVVRLQRLDFVGARLALEQQSRRDDGSEAEIPLLFIRLAAVHALESADRDAEAARLAAWSIAELARRGEVDQVIDLAERFGVDALGTEGFAPLYVRGVQQYKEAREQHEDQEPTAQPEVVALYDEAADWLRQAVAQPDAARFPDSGASAHLLLGWCLYFRGSFIDASEAFEHAAELTAQTTANAAEAMWMAVVALDRALRASQSAELADRVESMIDRFIEQFPSSEYTPKLILRQAEVRARAEAHLSPSQRLEVVEELLRIPANSPDFEHARRRASQMLYDLFHEERGDERIEHGRRYLLVAFPMWMRTNLDPGALDSASVTTFLMRGRRILEVALWPGINRYEAAAEVLNRLEDLAEHEGVDLSEVLDELDYRRMQVASGVGRLDQARLYADRIWERERGDWARASSRAMLREGVREWRAATPEDDIRSMLDRVLVYGKRTLQEYEDDDAALQDRTVLVYYATVAEAAMTTWEEFGSNDAGQLALVLYRTLLEAQPSNGLFLRSVGILSETFGEYETAREAWHRLAVGREAGTEPWFEARFHLIRTLLRIDAARARAVFDQHRALYPDLGPGDWQHMFEELDKDIDSALRIRAIERGRPGDPSGRSEEAN